MQGLVATGGRCRGWWVQVVGAGAGGYRWYTSHMYSNTHSNAWDSLYICLDLM